MYKQKVTAVQIIGQERGERTIKPDLLAAEEPMEIRLVYGPANDRIEKSLAVTMRTPGNDFELALGFLFTEGIINTMGQVESIVHCEQVKDEEERGNVVRVALAPDVPLDVDKLQRNFYLSSSCGVCGKSSIEAINVQCHAINSSLRISEKQLLNAPDAMREAQDVFEHTGGLHAAALFDESGKLIILREDIGRHNALDKLIGFQLANHQLPLTTKFVMVSGRLGFELVQKAVMAGIPILGAVGAPSSLAVKLAQNYGITLAGFVRNGRFNLYSGEERIV